MFEDKLKPIWDKLSLKIATSLDYFEDNDTKMAEEKVNEAYNLNRTLYDKTKEAMEALEAENAAMRERLEKAVELPVKVGDKVYIPWVWDNQSGIMEAPVVAIRLYPYTRKYEISLETDSLSFAQKYHYGNFNDNDFGTLVYSTREAAEARLKELKGGEE